MGKDDIYEAYKASPNTKIIAVYMVDFNHWTLSRAELKSFISEKGISSNVLVPEDGKRKNRRKIKFLSVFLLIFHCFI